MSVNIQTAPEISPARETAQRLVHELMNPDVQLQLFEDDDNLARFARQDLSRLKEAHPDKVVIDTATVDEYRYMAAFLGAGFHPSQYDEITYKDNDPEEVGKFIVGLFWQNGHVPARNRNSNRMSDEVLHNEMFTQVVKTTQLDLSGFYITSEEDLEAIFAYDYENLDACRRLDFDLLYERKD